MKEEAVVVAVVAVDVVVVVAGGRISSVGAWSLRLASISAIV